MEEMPSAEEYTAGHSDNRSVNQVSWYDAVRFCNALSTKEGLSKYYNITLISIDGTEGTSDEVSTVEITEGKGYLLSTEAEWEYAAGRR